MTGDLIGNTFSDKITDPTSKSNLDTASLTGGKLIAIPKESYTSLGKRHGVIDKLRLIKYYNNGASKRNKYFKRWSYSIK